MDNLTATPLEGKILIVNQLELVTPTTVAGTFYGIGFTLFCLYVHSLAAQLRDGDRKTRARFMLGYSTIIMLCGLYELVSMAWITQEGYLKHADFLGGPFAYIRSIYHSPVMTVNFSCQLAVDLLTSAIQIWRVWVIWSATRYAIFVTVLPVLCFLTFTALRLRTLKLESTLLATEVRQLDAKAQLVETATQVTTTILCTTLISLYLIFKQWQQRKLIGKIQGSTGYMNIVAIIVESYALETIWLLAMIIFWGQRASAFFGESVLFIEIIAYLLVQYRVASGKAVASQKGQRDISSLHWSRSNHATIQFGETNEIQSGFHVSSIPEAPDVPRLSSMA